MKILLTGGTGFVGRNLIPQLQRAGHQVTSLSRRQGIDFRSMQTIEAWAPWLRGIDAVINAVGIIVETGSQRFVDLHQRAPVALFDACVRHGVRRVIQISALGADASAFSAYHLSKRAADDHLRQLDLDWFVVRPSLIYGRGGGSSTVFERLARLPIIMAVGDEEQMLQPVHIADVVATVVHCLFSERGQITLDVVGDETVSFIDWMRRLRSAQGLGEAPVWRIPLRLALTLAGLGQPLSPMLRRENILMLVKGYSASVEPWTSVMGRPPLPFREALLKADANDVFADIGSTT